MSRESRVILGRLMILGWLVGQGPSKPADDRLALMKVEAARYSFQAGPEDQGQKVKAALPP